MKKLPKIDKFDISKKNNNKMIFDSTKAKEENFIEKEVSKDEIKFSKELTVKEKIKELINQNSYIFNKKVILVFLDHEETCQIAGVVNNHIITMDNKIISVDSLKDIKVLEK